jgi:translocation and assembly module TamB
VLDGAGRWLLFAILFLASLALAIAVHLDLAPVRRTICWVVNRVLVGVFEGRLVVGTIAKLDLHGVTFLDIDVVDPHGTQVIHVHELRADAELLGVAGSAVLGGGDVEIPVSHVHIDRADVALERGPEGDLTIQRAFELRGRGGSPGGRGVRLTLEHIAIDRARAHGAVAPPVALDADVSHVSARLTITAGEGLMIDVDPTPIDASTPLPGRVVGEGTFQLHRTGPGVGLAMAAGFTGKAADLGFHATARMRGDHFATKIEIPRATPSEVASLVPEGKALRAPIALAATAEGDLPELHVQTRATFDGGGAIDAAGTMIAHAPLTLDAAVALHAFDPRVLFDVPATAPIDAAGHVSFAGDVLAVDAKTAPLVISGQVIPAVDVRALRIDAIWSGAATVHEIGAPVEASFSFNPEKEILDVEADAEVASLRAVPRLGLPLDGAGHVHAKGSWRRGALDARATGRFRDLRAASAVGLHDAAMTVHLAGAPGALQLQASLQGRSFRAGFASWEAVSGKVSGPLLAPRLEATLDGSGEPLSLSGTLDAAASAVTGVRVQLGDGEIGLHVARIASVPGGARIEGIQLDGAGQLEGNLAVTAGELTGALHGTDVDLDKLARLAGMSAHVAGRASLALDLASTGPGRRRGQLTLDVTGGEVAEFSGLSGHLSATFDGDRVRADSLLQLRGKAGCEGVIAEVRVAGADARLPGALLDEAAWRRVSGKVDVAAPDWDLRCLRRLLPVERVAFTDAVARVAASESGATLYFQPIAAAANAGLLPDVRGKLSASATFERAPGALLPSVRSLSLKTEGLQVVAVNLRSLHTDLEIADTSLDAATGKMESTLSFRDGDPLVSLRLGATLDLPALLHAPAQRWASLRRTPLHGQLSVPRHAVTAFAGLPSFVTEHVPLLTGYGDTLAGEVQLDAKLQGTVDAPSIDARVEAWGLREATIPEPIPAEPGCTGGGTTPLARLGAWGLLVDADAHATYDGREAKLDGLHVRHDGREVASASGRLALPVADLFAGRPRPRGDLQVTLDRVPIGEVPYFADLAVVGQLSGSVKMTGLGDRPSVHVALKIPDLAIGHDLAYDRAEIAVDVPEPASGHSDARASLTLSGHAGGELAVSASAKVSWEHGKLLPLPDQSLPAELTLKATRFRVAAAAPFLPQRIVRRLDGILDGTVHLAWSQGQGAQTVPIAAQLALEGGVLDLPQLGQRFYDIRARIGGGRDGRVELSQLRARGGKGVLQGTGSASFERWAWRCADIVCLSRAEVQLSVAAAERIPLTFDGVPVGDAYGTVKLAAGTRDGRLALTVAPALHVALDPSLGRSVQSLDDDPAFNLCYAPKPPVTSRRISIAVPLSIALSGKILGDRVNIVDGNLTGDLRVELGGEHARVSGAVTVKRGSRVELLQKQLEIATGRLTLNPDDPDRSVVDVMAQWEAPEGHLEIGYSGRVTPIAKTGLSCHLGARYGDDCFAALLFGSSEQASATTGAGAQPLSLQVLARIAGNVSTRVGTADDGSPQAGLVYDAGAAKLGVSTYYGVGAAGAPSAAGAAALQGERTVLTLDWRFWRNWVLQGRADLGGDQQTLGADVFWQHRF